MKNQILKISPKADSRFERQRVKERGEKKTEWEKSPYPCSLIGPFMYLSCCAVLFSDGALCVGPRRKELKEVCNTSVSTDRVRAAALGATDF